MPVKLELKFTQSDLVNQTMTATTTEMLLPHGTYGVDWLERSAASPSQLVASASFAKAGLSSTSVNASGQTNPQFVALLQDAAASGMKPNGIMTFLVTSGGLVTTVTQLGDGTDASLSGTGSAYLGADGTVPMYRGIYGSAYPTSGQLAGVLKLNWTGANAVSVLGSGYELEWKKPTSASGYCVKLNALGSRFDPTLTVTNVIGVMSGLTFGLTNPQQSTIWGLNPNSGLDNLVVKSNWLIDTSVGGTPRGNAVFTNPSTAVSTNSPAIVLKVTDSTASPGKFYQTSGIIMQTPPAGVAPGVYGLIPYIPNGSATATWTEWYLR